MVDLRDDDSALVAAARTGDQEAFAAIFDRYAPRVHAFCQRVLGDPHTAADATQDAFVAASMRLDQLRDPSKLRAWLYAVARNECTRHGRARDRAIPVEDAAMTADLEFGADRDEPADHAGAAEVGELLWAAADGLDERDRVLLELQVRHGLEGAELAEAAGVPAGQISMATGRLRERVERSVGALLVARRGRKDCPGLRIVLEDWDGTFSVLMRKRVARHIDRCDTCEDRRAALVAPLGALVLAPAVVPFALADLPVDLRANTLEAIRRATTGGGGEAGGGGGDARRRRLVAAVALLLVLVAAAVAVAVTAGGSDDGDRVTAAKASSVTTAPASSPGKAQPTSAAGGSSTSTVTVATQGRGDTTAPVGQPGATTTAVAPASVPPPTAPPVTFAPPTAPKADHPPSVGTLVRSGTSAMQTSCNPANATRTVTVSVTDDHGVSGVVLRWTHSASGPGQAAMAKIGASTWRATLGPFSTPGSVAFRAVATDSNGAAASSSTSSATVDPCPG